MKTVRLVLAAVSINGLTTISVGRGWLNYFLKLHTKQVKIL